MAENTAIEWCDHTFNPWIGCAKVSPGGCANCYAETRMDKRLHVVQWGAGQPRKRTKTWGDPVRWNDQHEAFFAQHGRRQRVFCASLADVFDNEVPPEWRADLFKLIEATPHLDWLLLTKRIGNVEAMACQANWPMPMPRNVWLGATVVNQAEADRDIPKLLTVPARVRFLSIEPMLGPIDLTRVRQRFPAGVSPWSCLQGYCLRHYPRMRCGCSEQGRAIDWVICGGESGPNARPMHPDWARSLRDQCAAAGVPFLFKQWGELIEMSQSPDLAQDSFYTADGSQWRHPTLAGGLRCFEPTNDDERAAWLRGLFDSEGNVVCVRKPRNGAASWDRRVVFLSTNVQMLGSALVLLSDLGIAARLSAWSCGRGHRGSKQVMAVTLKAGRDNFARFAAVVGSSIKRKQDALNLLPKTYQSAGGAR